jgi:hypothetical protein
VGRAAVLCPADANPLTRRLRLALLDRQPPQEVPSELPPAADLRVSTLTPSSVALLRSVGAWASLAPAAAPFCNMQARRRRGGRALRGIPPLCLLSLPALGKGCASLECRFHVQPGASI